MAKRPKIEYSGLPLEIRETISQYLDIKSLIALGAYDPDILKRTFTNRLSRTTFKKNTSVNSLNYVHLQPHQL